MKLSLSILLATLLVPSVPVLARTPNDGVADSVSIDNGEPQTAKKPGLIKRIIDSFSDYDENYIEPQHYLFTGMLQATYSYDYYTLRSTDNSQSVSLAPDGVIKLGPYFGWKWLFAGYTFTLGASSFNKTKTEFDLSFYTSRFGIDLFYRRTGSDYKLRNVRLGNDISTTALQNVPFDGVKAGITGLDF